MVGVVGLHLGPEFCDLVLDVEVFILFTSLVGNAGEGNALY